MAEDQDKRPTEATRRRVDEIFGDVLPDTTSDEREPGQQRTPDSDSWYLENRPPHHDR